MSDKTPEQIFLQWFDQDGEPVEEVTWCKDQILDSDVVYVRSDIAEDALREQTAKTIEMIAERHAIGHALDEQTARIAELEAENAQLREAQRWIPIEERLPEDDEVLAWGDERTDTVFTDGEAWYCYTGIGKVFTHWMPLPPPPHHQE